MTASRAALPFLLALLAACGTEGPTGPQGPAGPDIDRSKIYCDTVSGQGTQLSNTWTQVAACRAQADIPLEGSCYLSADPGVSDFFYSSRSAPISWNDPTTTAKWICEWSPLAGAPSPIAVTAFPGRTEICCITKP